jgi:hypothetical protein
MDCRDLRTRLSDFQDGALPATVAEEVSVHLQACGACAEVARTLNTLRDHLRELPPLPAPPELLARVRESVARERAFPAPAAAPLPGRAFPSRLKVPLQAAAVVLLFASVYWYQTGSAPPYVPGKPAPAPGIASSASPRASGRIARPASRTAAPPAAERPAPLEQGRREGVSTLPPDTPEPKVRIWSRADLPAAPALRTGTDAERIVPGFPGGGQAAGREPVAIVVRDSPRQMPFRYVREVLLDVTPEGRIGAEERVAAAARNLGGTVEGEERAAPEGTVAVHVLLPEHAESAFLEGLARIGKIPPEGRPAESVPPAGHDSGTIAYTVNLRVR